MLIEISTDNFQEHDAHALVGLIKALYPHLINSASVAALEAIPPYPAERYLAAAENGYADPDEAFAEPAPLDPVAAFATPAEAPLSPAAETPAGASTPPPAGAALTVDLDADSLPWDARIHAGTKTKNADLRWKAKKGVHPDTKASVTAELRAVMGAPAPPAPAAAPPPPPVAAAAPPPPPPAEAAPAPVNGMQLFAGAMQKVTAAQADQKLTPEDLAAVVMGLGLTQVRDLINRPDLVPTFEAHISALVASAAG